MWRFSLLALYSFIVACNSEVIPDETTVLVDQSPAEGENLKAPESTKHLVLIKFKGTLYPDSLKKLSNLEDLTFEQPEIQEIKPGSLCQSPKLNTIILNLADVKELKKEDFTNCENLKQLEIRYKEFPIASGAFSELKNLETLLTAQFIWRKLSKGTFAGLSNLKKLSLTSGDIEDIDPEAFEGLSNLEELDLKNNKLSVVTGDEFKLLPNLKLLDINYNPTTAINIDQLLKNLPKLERINLSLALLNDADKEKVRQTVASKDIALETL